MDPRLLQHYNRELRHLREMGAEFAQEFPKIAARLGVDGVECADPYVERLLEGFAFLAARIQMKLDAEFPKFTQHLLQMVYPHYLAPTPSMAVVRFEPTLSEGSLGEGFVVPRGSALRSLLGKGEQTACEYRTSQDVTLWPLELREAEYFAREYSTITLPRLAGVKAGLRLRLRTTAGLKMNDLALAALPLFLRGVDDLPMRLYEQFFAAAVGVIVRPIGNKPAWQEFIAASEIRRLGYNDDEALLPVGPRSFSGYRLLQEYFALPQRFLFAEIGGLAPAVRKCADEEIEIIVLFDRLDAGLEERVNAEAFDLFCAPAVNLFPVRADRIHLTEGNSEHHIVPDRTRPMDFEVHQVTDVVGYGTSGAREQRFHSFYSFHDAAEGTESVACYTLRRIPRVLSERQQEVGPRSSYIGSEAFLTLVDRNEAPYHHDLRQLAVQTLCTNRDLPLFMPIGVANTDFTLESGAPVESIRCVAGPTRPRPSSAYADGDPSWRLISHLSLNYLSLADTDDRRGAAALRELLGLYGETSETAIRKQIEGVRGISAAPIIRRVPVRGPIAYGRGHEVTLTLDETAFEGSGVFLLGAVLEQFFARYVAINSFTETVVHTLERGEVIRWPVRIGQRQVL